MATKESTATTTATTEKVTRAKAENFIAQTAEKVEKMTRAKALSEAVRLHQGVEQNYFVLGGVLKKIYENTWFDDHGDFNTYVEQVFGFKARKAHYLMEIYTELTFNQIPYQLVAHLGWTKIKELAKILTIDNVQAWAEKASGLTVKELQALISSQNGAPTSEDSVSTSTQSDTKKMAFVFKNDQIETVTTAIAKAKAEAGTEFDNVALENICGAYLGDVNPIDWITEMRKMGTQATLQLLEQAFPEAQIEVSL